MAGAPEGGSKIQRFLLVALLILGPALLFVLYYQTLFPGLTNADALDFAQLGRNLSSGRGFVTYILRPLALTHGSDALRQPDVTHGPLYPFLLALAFGAIGAKDSAAAMVSGFFFVLTIPAAYLLGRRAFNHQVGLATALILMFNALLLEYATSGLNITLYIFLTTCLLLVLHSLANELRNQGSEGGADGPMPRSKLLACGFLLSLLYLTEPMFFWFVPALLAGLLLLVPTRRWPAAAAWLLLPIVLTAGPWMARNGMLAGNPFFGLRGSEVWMGTRSHYPGLSGYRTSPGSVIGGAGLVNDVLEKMLLGFVQIMQAFPQIAASWVLAFFLPGLLFRFSNPVANTHRWLLLACLGSLMAGSMLFRVQMPQFVSLFPAMLVFAIAFLVHLTRQAALPRGGIALVTSLIAAICVTPLLSQLTIETKPGPLPSVASARALGEMADHKDAILSDQPWVTAWHADRPSLWIPVLDSDTKALRQKFASTRWMMLTEQAQGYSSRWPAIYQTLRQWNIAAIRSRDGSQPAPPSFRISGAGDPLLEALDGFAPIPPIATKESESTTVLAGLPPSQTKISSSDVVSGPIREASAAPMGQRK